MHRAIMYIESSSINMCIILCNPHCPPMLLSTGYFLGLNFSRNHEQTSSRIHGINLASARKSLGLLLNVPHQAFTTKASLQLYCIS